MACNLTIRIPGEAAYFETLQCAGCQHTHREEKCLPITGTYNFETHEIEWDLAVVRNLQSQVIPEGWSKDDLSQMIDRNGRFTYWTRWFCPTCSAKRDNQ